VVVELLEPHPGLDLEAGGQAARQRLALDDGDAIAALREAERDDQPQRAGAEDRGPGQARDPSATGRP
jgi:hypothetical protein